MAMLIIYFVLLVLFTLSSAYSLSESFSTPLLLTHVAGFVGILSAFMMTLTRHSVRAYLFWHRIRLWWHSDSVTRWWFSARFEGDYDHDTLKRVKEFVTDPSRFRFRTTVDYFTGQKLLIDIEGTLVLEIGLDLEYPSGATTSRITLMSKAFEVPYGYSRRKIDTQIVPTILALKDHLRPRSDSYDLEIQFIDANPFFALYVANLRPEQIGDFHVVLHLDQYSPNHRIETVEISRENLHVSAQSTDSFKQLALDFILLSMDVKTLRGARTGA